MAISKTWRSYVSRYRIKHKSKQYVLFVPSIRKKKKKIVQIIPITDNFLGFHLPILFFFAASLAKDVYEEG